MQNKPIQDFTLLTFMTNSLILSAFFSVCAVVNGNSSSHLLCTSDNSDSETVELLAVNRNISVQVDGMSYKLKSTSHMPVFDEADSRFAYLRKGEKLNFVLEFEEFPAAEGFDLVDPGCEAGNFSRQNVSPATGSKSFEYIEDFLSATPYAEYGRHFENGFPVSFIEDDILRFELDLTQVYEVSSEHNQIAWLEIYNKSDKQLPMKAGDIRTSGTREVGKNRRTQPNKVAVHSPKQADKNWHEYDQNVLIETRQRSAGETAAATVTDAALSATESLLGPASILAFVGRVGAIAIQDGIDRDAVEPELTEKNRIREETMAYYLTEATIEPNSSEPFFAFIGLGLDSRQKTVSIDFKVGDRNYIFNW